MKLPRFRIRTMMILIALCAIACLPAVVAEREERFRRLMRYHKSRQFAVDDQPIPPPISRERAEWHWRMEEKYRRAADRPWLPVKPDPPAPE